MEITKENQGRFEKGRPNKKGGVKTLPFIIVNEVFEKVAGYGLHANMILYLTKEYHYSKADGTSLLYLWFAFSNFMPVVGAFLSDSYLGRFRVLASASLVNLVGLILLWLTAVLRDARPPPCDKSTKACPSASVEQQMLLFSAFALMAIGAGGIRPCSIAFGADQINDPEHPKNERRMQTYFSWYYASACLSIMVSVTVIVYIQNAKGWKVGFGVPVVLMFLAAVLFFVGASMYVKLPPNRSLLGGFAQVIVASWKKRCLTPSSKSSGQWNYYHKGSKVDRPTDKLRFLNKACMIVNAKKELDSNGLAVDPWYLCTVRKVEELKAIIRVLPIWSTGIVVAVIIAQQSFPVFQASTMDRRITSRFSIPAGSFGVFGILTITIWVLIYDRAIVPLTVKLTKRPGGLTLKQRMGIGLSISCLSMMVAALVEQRRRATAIREGYLDNPDSVISMSALWMAPQHCLMGLAEAFFAIGQIEFYYSEFPKWMASIAMALLAFGIAVGSLVGSQMVRIIKDLSSRGGNQNWLSDNLNRGHYDRYYWVLTGLTVANLLYYLVCSWAYGSCNDPGAWDEEDLNHTVGDSDHSDKIRSPLVIHT
ncbi:hypothetical protein MLD38_014787 [Melastoma candidum]|uniref:Uncharacterized protein n=1 Tax=Melastoma candidum TaxID=119954 RepID=A0ACB9RD83_9MYRT|nr:hypothetical protein MLD38_014787 [Melastoma candidum]